MTACFPSWIFFSATLKLDFQPWRVSVLSASRRNFIESNSNFRKPETVSIAQATTTKVVTPFY